MISTISQTSTKSFSDCIKGQWIVALSALSKEETLLKDFNKQLIEPNKLILDEITKAKSDRKQLKVDYQVKRAEAVDKIAKLKKSQALLLYVIMHHEELRVKEQGNNSGEQKEEEKGINKYIKKYENMKLFIENPVSLI